MIVDWIENHDAKEAFLLGPSTCTTPWRQEPWRRGRSRVLPVRSKTARRVAARIVVAWLPFVCKDHACEFLPT